MSTADLMLRWAIALLLAATRVAGKTCSRSLPGSGAASLNSGSPECFSFWTRNREREPLVRIWGDVLPTWLEGADLEIGCQCCRESEWVWGSRVGALPSQRCSSELCVLCVRESKRRAPIIRFKDWEDPGPAVQLWGRYSEVQDLGGSPQLHSNPAAAACPKTLSNPTSHRTPEFLLGAGGTGEPRATPLTQWRKRMRCRGVAYTSLPGRVGLHIRAEWVRPAISPLPCEASVPTLPPLPWSGSLMC